MSTKRHREQALLFVGALYSSPEVYAAVLPVICKEYGPALFESGEIPWDHSRYYTDELGSALWKRFVFFERLIEASLLPDIKILTDDIESAYADGGKRRINLDPGYLTEAKVILASTKNYSHRIYLGKGIYAEQEYVFGKGLYQPLPHAYADYRKPAYLKVFSQARTLFRQIIDPERRPDRRKLTNPAESK